MVIRNNILLSALLSLCLMTALPVSAEEGGPPCPNGRPNGARAHHEPGEFGPPHFLNHLQLSEAQRDQVFKIMHDQAPEKHAIEKELRKARTALQTIALSENYSETEAKKLINAETQAYSNLLKHRTETMRRLDALLTPDQRRKAGERDSFAPPFQG